MPNKVLFCATVDYHFKAFHLPYLKWFKEQGWDVHIVANGKLDLPYVDEKFDIPIQRSPFRAQNLYALKELKEIIDRNKYSIIHCHTPMGGVLTRLAAYGARKTGSKMFYTAHGFHFCKGASFLNWMTYYPIERVLAHMTDHLITINQEDYQLAVNHRFKAGRIEHIRGVGVDTDRFRPIGTELKNERRRNLGYAQDDFLMIYTAEFNKNKNQQLLIKSMDIIKHEVPKAKLLLAGEGPLLVQCKELVRQCGLTNHIEFLGYRNDIDQLLPICDLALSASYREGLPVNIMEAMATGLPIIATKNRGTSELIQNGVNGFLIQHDGHNKLAIRMLELYNSKEICRSMGENNYHLIKKFSLNQVITKMNELYLKVITEGQDEAQSKYSYTNI